MQSMKFYPLRPLLARLLLVLTLVGVTIPALSLQTVSAHALQSPVAAQLYAIYTVRAGDTLSAIGRRTGTTVNNLVSINQLSNANQIAVGQTILVPAAVEDRGNTTNYTVRRGDTIYSLARRFNTTAGVLTWLNGISNPNSIRVGQVLIVPGAGGTGSTAPTRIRFAAGSTSATVTGNIAAGNRNCYIFGGAAGQTATIQLTSPGNLANFDFAPVDLAVNGGVPFKRLVNEDRTFSQLLPVTADYLICVAIASGSTSYSLTLTIPPASSACTSPTTDIRSVNWNIVLPDDPALSHEIIGGQHYVTVIGASPTVSGIPLPSMTVYADFDNDCIEEAAMPLDSGGTAGSIGYLVYRMGARRPNLIAWGDGYKLSLTASSTRLVVSNAVYAGWEPNCCPSGLSHATYRLVGNVLTLVSTTSEGFPGMQVATVEQFYSYLNNHDFANAYALLSPAFKAANPFATWQAGYSNTISFAVTVNADPGVANRVQVTINAVESTSGGGSVNRTYVGSWDTIWGGNGWLLNHGAFHLG